MKPLALVLSSLALLAISACGKSGDRAAGVAPAASTGKPATAGSIDIAVGGETINANSRGDAGSVQCQLSFTATNSSAVNIKSLLVNYDALRISSGEVVKAGWQLVIPVAIKAGAVGAPFGTEPIDDVPCDDLKLRFGPQPSYQCRTEDKKPCAAFRYQAKGVAVEAVR